MEQGDIEDPLEEGHQGDELLEGGGWRQFQRFKADCRGADRRYAGRDAQNPRLPIERRIDREG